MRLLLGTFIFLLSTSCVQAAYFITVTDVHFDPFTTCAKQINNNVCPIVKALRKADASHWSAIFSKEGSKKMVGYGSDSDYLLLLSTLREIHRLNACYHPSFVLFIGDYLTHDFQLKYIQYSGDSSAKGYKAFVKKTIQYLTMVFRHALPQVPIYPVVGNNDSYGGDYRVRPNGAFFRDLSHIWPIFLYSSDNEGSFSRDFSYAGYYAVTLQTNPSARLIVLNSVLFSKHVQGPNVATAAQAQLSWLQQQLAQAKSLKQPVWLTFHIPTGMDIYKTAMTGINTLLWNPTYIQAFIKLVNKYSKNIHGIFTSHLHMDGFALFANQKVLDSYSPSISPVLGNNPSMKVFRYDAKTFQLNDFVVYYLPVNNPALSWRVLYDFNQHYQPNCQNCLLIQGMQQLYKNPKNNLWRSTYVRYYAAGTKTQPISKPINWNYYWCGVLNFLPMSYGECLKARVAK